MIQWLLRRLAAPRAALLVIALGVALQAPSLDIGFVADDHLHQLILRGDTTLPGLPDSPVDLFTFAGRPTQRTRALMERGVFPWTTDPAVRLAFFRPLSALTHRLDHLLAPESAAAAHAQNLLWFALSLVAVAWVYRRLIGPTAVPGAAGLALLLYAVDDARGPTVGWIANRNALVALALALPAVALHDRWRRDGWRPGALLAPLALALGLGAGESAVAVLAYLFAYALCLDERPGRWWALGPFALVTALWLGAYRALGYGASGSGVYLDPIGDAGAFLAALPARLSLLLLGQLALPWSDFAELYRYGAPGLSAIMTAVALGLLALLGVFAAPLWRRSAAARFFAVGMMLAAIPVCATFPADRLLSFVGVGGMGLVALILVEPRSRRGARVVVGVLVAIHLVLAPPLAALRSRSMETVERALARGDRSLPSLAGQTAVLVNPPGDLLAGYIPIERAARRQPQADYQRVLAAGNSALTITRLDGNTLLLRPEAGFLANVTERMLVRPSRRFAVGERITLPGLTIEIRSLTPDGRPAEVAFRFARALEDPSLAFFRWSDDGYVPFALPPVAGSVTLPALSFVRAVFAPPPK